MNKILFSSLLILLVFVGGYSQSNNDYEEASYGTVRSVGISILGNGLIGVPVRIIMENQDQLEIVPAFTGRGLYRRNLNGDTELDKIFYGVNVLVGYNLFLGSRYKERKNKIRKNYLSFKGGLQYTELASELNFALSWHREGFFNGEPKMSRGLDLGLQFSRALGNDYFNAFGSTDLTQDMVGLFLRFDWNWFRKSK